MFFFLMAEGDSLTLTSVIKWSRLTKDWKIQLIKKADAVICVESIQTQIYSYAQLEWQACQ